MPKCEHLKLANPKVGPTDDGCTECRKAGQPWVELRQCMVCGHVGCCDSSPGQHARNHFKDTGHPVMKPLESGGWQWCYEHDAYV